MMMSDYTKNWAGSAKIDYVVLSNGGRLRYLKTGTGSALLLMHTLRTQLDYFRRLIPRLTDYFTVYAVDLPGLGWSDVRPGASYEEPAIRRDIVEFIERLDLKDLTLAGESMGATLSLSAAAELGSRVGRVVALNTYDYPQGVERANLLASIVVKAMQIPGIGLIPAKLENELILSGILRGGFFDPKNLPSDFVQELLRSARRPGSARVQTAYFRSLKSFAAARQFYSRVKAPVTFVYGDHDWSKPSEREVVARLVPGSRMITLADTGHFASLEHPDEVARILIDTATVF
jgi:pimeloyl-ACP methyl ester carboxylesterase